MRIAIIAPLAKPVPPTGYGGIERVVHEFSEGLVRAGHDVTLFARPGSRSSGTLCEVDPGQGEITGLNRPQDFRIEDALLPAVEATLATRKVDILHDWSLLNTVPRARPDLCPMVISSCIPPPQGEWRNLVAASHAHARLFGDTTPCVRYGLDLSRFDVRPKADGPLVHMAKICPSKAQHRALIAAAWAGREVDIVGNIESRRYFNFVIRPMIAVARKARYLGEAKGTIDALRDSIGLVQTPAWFEVLPLVAIEALAMGRPVIGWNSGGLPEAIVEGRNGYVVDSVRALADAMEAVRYLDPDDCREVAEERFNINRMVRQYLAIYERVLDGEGWTSSVRAASEDPPLLREAA